VLVTRPSPVRLCVATAAALLPMGSTLVAHDAHELASEAVHRWTFDPLVVVPLIVTAALYAAGIVRLRQHSAVWRGIASWRIASFAAGWVTIVLALVSPVAWLSEILFSVHMTQHTLLMLVAAPLMMFGHPLFVWLWAFNAAPRTSLCAVVLRRPVRSTWQALTAPLSVFLLNGLALWIWHLPLLYQAALRHTGIHALEHLSFLLASSLFWWGMVHGRYGRIGYGLGVLYVFLTGVHSSALGALLTVSPSVWYGDYARQAAVWRIDALADQQLAGLLMWIPAGVIFLIFGLALFAAWLGESERRVLLGRTEAIRRHHAG
jgi:cytochrome c oxidase assembly factor CtaG